MKKLKKIVVFIVIPLVIIFGINLLTNQDSVISKVAGTNNQNIVINENKKSLKEENTKIASLMRDVELREKIINIKECPEEFMTTYFAEVEEISQKNNEVFK